MLEVNGRITGIELHTLECKAPSKFNDFTLLEVSEG
jgi:hypothetical protein